MSTEIIVALDVDTLKEEEALLEKLHGTITHYKIGLRLFTAHGRKAVELVQKKGGQVFLDLKFHDIPETVSQAVRQAHRLGVLSVSVHLWGGVEMLKAAAEVSPRPKLWGVTVLTSMAEEDLRFIHPDLKVAETAAKLAKTGQANHVDGIICSAQEVAELRGLLGAATTFITPGIRPADSAKDDQRRIVTPADAAKLGIRYIVVGRPITKAADPLKAAQAIVGEMRHAVPSSVEKEKARR